MNKNKGGYDMIYTKDINLSEIFNGCDKLLKIAKELGDEGYYIEEFVYATLKEVAYITKRRYA